jgi:putative addiction module killer protein
MEYTLKVYETPAGRQPFLKWLRELKDQKARTIIRLRLDRVRLGNLGDCKPVGGGVYELRIDFGPGYRVYYGKIGQVIILLLNGGDKRSQDKDIRTALELFTEYKGREANG